VPGQPAIGDFAAAALSPDGRFLLYSSDADGLVAGPANGKTQAYLYDRASDTSFLLSGAQGSPTVGGNGDSQPVALSDDGRYVLLQSTASDLVAGLAVGTGNVANIYLLDRMAQRISLVSHRHGVPEPAAIGATAVGMSADARFVLFGSAAPDLSATIDANQSVDVFVWDRDTDRTELVSRRPGGAVRSSDGASTARAISADGGRVLFDSTASDLVAGAGGPFRSQVYVADRERGTITLVSHAAGSDSAGSDVGATAGLLSRDGRCVVFSSLSTDLVSGTGLRGNNLYRGCRDRPVQRITEPVVIEHAPSSGSVFSSELAVSPDGARVLYLSRSGALDESVADPNSDSDALLALHQDDQFRDDYE
jgi:Tol biopolymer transport system component